MRWTVPLLALLVLLTAAPGAQALQPDEMFKDPAKEQRARDIGRSLRCLVCQNQSIFDSNAGLARDLRVLVRERIEAGDNNQQVLDYVYERYGAYVLLEPPVDPRTYFLWAAPVLFLGIAAGWFTLRMRRRGGDRASTELAEADRAEARRILEGNDT